jgi:hypothetical protein
MSELRALSDDELLADLGRLVGARQRLTARMLLYLGEIEERRLHLKAAYPSMFEFLLNELGMSEGEAYRHLAGARLGRAFPLVIELVESGKLHLSGLVLLRDFLTEQNHVELLNDAASKTTRAIEALLVARFPKPAVEDTIRKLPDPTQPALRLDSAATGNTPEPRPPVKGRIEPLSPERYKIQFTASQELVEKLEHAKNLLSHTNPSGELAVIVARAVELLIAELEKKKLGKTERPRRARPAKRGAVTRAARREVFGRDGLQCTYVDERTGRRCQERAFLELDHVDPRGRGGSGDAERLRVRCRAHNRLYAEQVYGRDLIEERIHFRYRKYDPGSAEGDVDATYLKLAAGLERLGFSRKQVRPVIDCLGFTDRAGCRGSSSRNPRRLRRHPARRRYRRRAGASRCGGRRFRKGPCAGSR